MIKVYMIHCQRTISTQKLKLLSEFSGYDLYCSLTHPLKWKPFRFETCINSFYLMLNFYQKNRDDEIRTRNHLVIKTLIPYQRTISIQKFKFLDKVLKYNLYYFLTYTCIYTDEVSLCIARRKTNVNMYELIEIL
jgi:hypothetical protein